ncbi:MAG: hypothetical protein ACRYFV_15625 [Janthinobacterium lividum]
MVPKNLDTLDGSDAWWQELRNRIANAYSARSQLSQDQRDAALKALKEFRDYPRLPHYEGLRQYAVDAIADFLLNDIQSALNGLSALEHGLQTAAQHELHTTRFIADAFKPRQHLLRVLTSLTALQTHYSNRTAVTGRSTPLAHQKKIDQVFKIVEELLTQIAVPDKSHTKPARTVSNRTTNSKMRSKS